MSPGRVRWFLGCVLLLSVGAAPFLVRGDQAREALKKQHQAEIAALSETDRARILERNFQVFKELPESSRGAIVSLHSQLEADRKKNGPLAATLETYYQWVKTLEPYQREELQQTQDTAQRLALMQRFLTEQSEQRAQVPVPEQLREFGSDHGRRGPPPPPLMTSETLARVVAEIEQVVFHRLSVSQRSELTNLDGFPRTLRLLEFIREESLRAKDYRLLSLKDDEELQRVIAVIEDSRVKEYLSVERNWIRLRWHSLLGSTLKHELEMASSVAPRAPSAATLRADFEKLSAKEQDALLLLSASDFIDELTRRNQEHNAPVNRQDLDDLFRIPQEYLDHYESDFFRRFDKNQDGMITINELPADLPEQFRSGLSQLLHNAGAKGLPVGELAERARKLRSRRPGEGPRPPFDGGPPRPGEDYRPGEGGFGPRDRGFGPRDEERGPPDGRPDGRPDFRPGPPPEEPGRFGTDPSGTPPIRPGGPPPGEPPL